MPALANKIYFNYGGQGPLPTASLHAMAESWRRIQELGPFAPPAFSYVGERITALRQALAASAAFRPSVWRSRRTSPPAVCCPSGACLGALGINC